MTLHDGGYQASRGRPVHDNRVGRPMVTGEQIMMMVETRIPKTSSTNAVETAMREQLLEVPQVRGVAALAGGSGRACSSSDRKGAG